MNYFSTSRKLLVLCPSTYRNGKLPLKRVFSHIVCTQLLKSCMQPLSSQNMMTFTAL